MQDTWVPFLGQKEPLERDMAAHSGVRYCRVPWARGLAGTAPGIAELGTAPGYSHDLHQIEQNDSRKGVWDLRFPCSSQVPSSSSVLKKDKSGETGYGPHSATQFRAPNRSQWVIRMKAVPSVNLSDLYCFHLILKLCLCLCWVPGRCPLLPPAMASPPWTNPAVSHSRWTDRPSRRSAAPRP